MLYRRWPNRPELVVAALRHHTSAAPIGVPDTGTLRDDLLALLRHMSARVGEVAGVFSFLIADYYREAGLPPAALRERAVADARSEMALILERHAAGGPGPPRPDHDPGTGAGRHPGRDCRPDLPAPGHLLVSRAV